MISIPKIPLWWLEVVSVTWWPDYINTVDSKLYA